MQEQNWFFHKTPYLNCLSVFSEYIDSNNCFVKLGVRWLNKLIIQMFLKGNVIDNMENQQILYEMFQKLVLILKMEWEQTKSHTVYMCVGF